MRRFQIALRVGAVRQYLLGADHQPVEKAAEHHHQPDHDIHDADFFMIDGGEPFAEQIGNFAVIQNRGGDQQSGDRREAGGELDDGVVVGNGGQRQPAE